MRTQLAPARAVTRILKILRALLAIALVIVISALVGGWVSYLATPSPR